MGFHHDDAKRTLAVRLYQAEPETLVDDIAARVGVSRNTVKRWARESGLPPRPPARPRLYSAEDDALAVQLYTQTDPPLSMLDVMAKTGMSDSRVRAVVVAAGKPLRTRGRPKKYDHDEVMRLDKEHGPNEAARRLGCGPAVVHYHRDVERRLKARAQLKKGRAA